MLGRYELVGRLASGGMATVYLARHLGEAGFQRLFAIKVLHPHLAESQDFVTMLLDEARIAARLHHPNVVPIVDLGSQDGLHFVVMEYVEGCSLAALLRQNKKQRPARLIVSIMLDVLAGLYAAHTLTDDDGNLMNLVHRDVSPQNVMIGADGMARLTDFGIARAESRLMTTRPGGQLKGKIAFMSPEHVNAGLEIDQRADVFSAGAMLWSALTARRLFAAQSDAATITNILSMTIPPASTVGCRPPEALDGIMQTALERDRADRFQTALAMEDALREAASASNCVASTREVAAWVTDGFGDELRTRRQAVKHAASLGPLVPDSQGSQPSLHSLPAVGSGTPSDVGFDTPAPSQAIGDRLTPTVDLQPSVELTPSSAGTLPAADAEPDGRQHKRRLLVAVTAALAVAVLVTAILLTGGSETPVAATAAPIALVTPMAAATAALDEALAPSPQVKALPSADSAAPAKSTVSLPAKKKRLRSSRSRTAKKKPAAPPPSKLAETAVPVSPPPPKQPERPSVWDKDSPLPPP